MKPLIYLIVLLLLLSGCARNREAELTIDVLNPPAQSAGASAAPAAAGEEESAFGINPAVAVLDSAAYVYEGSEGRLLYGAVEYENTGDCPVYIESARFSFRDEGGKTQEEEFQPPLSGYDIVMPGERSYVTAWLKTESFEPGAALELHAALVCLRAGERRRDILVEDIFLADNYPRFTTMTGRLVNQAEEAASLNMVYAGFYDEKGRLLCVWYFTKNAQLERGEDIRFVTHLREMPFSDLAQRASAVRAVGFGF